MRVLFLRRQRFGGVATLTQLLAEALAHEGVEAVVDDAEDAIPNKTGPAVDRDVSKAVRAAARGFDVVHAFGYRSAWACAEAFDSGPWVYTAHDMPKTTHPELIERLNRAHGGACSSNAVRDALATAKGERLRVLYPGLPADRRVLDKKEARAMLGASDDVFLIACAGRFCAEHSLDTAVHVTTALPHHARLVICGQGELEEHLRGVANERTTIKTEPFSQQAALAAADVALVPSTVAGFSYAAIEAMYAGTPAVLRRTGGLTEIAEDHRRGYYFDTDEELLDLLNHLCFKRELLFEVGRAARQRIIEAFDIAATAKGYTALYESALGSNR